MKQYGEAPEVVGRFNLTNPPEIMAYQYLPIKMNNSDEFRLEKRLDIFQALITMVVRDCNTKDHYVYLTAKHGYSSPESPLNRPGWHADGFGTEDTNYVWCDSQPTEFAIQPFHNISENHTDSILSFGDQTKKASLWSPSINTVLRLNSYVVHRVSPNFKPGWRTFVKISVSKEKYNLQGNSHNYLFDYNWTMYSREAVRNHPSCGEADSIKSIPE